MQYTHCGEASLSKLLTSNLAETECEVLFLALWLYSRAFLVYLGIPHSTRTSHVTCSGQGQRQSPGTIPRFVGDKTTINRRPPYSAGMKRTFSLVDPLEWSMKLVVTKLQVPGQRTAHTVPQ